MGSRTILDFDYSGDIMSVFDTWAANAGLRLLNEQEGKRTYQKVMEFWLCRQGLKSAKIMELFILKPGFITNR